VISLINKAISGINSLGVTIPSWVPEIGGQKFGINIAKIPLLAKGGFTDGPSIAGEAGREAVISFDSSVRAKNIATWMKAGKLLGIGSANKGAELKQIDTGGYTGGEQIVFAPVINIQGNADKDTTDDLLERMQSMFEEWYEQKQRMQRRTAY
jgi:hypothetical protein